MCLWQTFHVLFQVEWRTFISADGNELFRGFNHLPPLHLHLTILSSVQLLGTCGERVYTRCVSAHRFDQSVFFWVKLGVKSDFREYYRKSLKSKIPKHLKKHRPLVKWYPVFPHFKSKLRVSQVGIPPRSLTGSLAIDWCYCGAQSKKRVRAFGICVSVCVCALPRSKNYYLLSFVCISRRNYADITVPCFNRHDDPQCLSVYIWSQPGYRQCLAWPNLLLMKSEW